MSKFNEIIKSDKPTLIIKFALDDKVADSIYAVVEVMPQLIMDMDTLLFMLI